MSENVSEANAWTPNQHKFIRWLATPSQFREQRTYAEFADSIGVAERTLYRWKDLDGLTLAVTDLARGFLADDLPEIYGALRKKARAGSFPHVKLSLELAGEYVERRELTGAGGGPVEYEVVWGDD